MELDGDLAVRAARAGANHDGPCFDAAPDLHAVENHPGTGIVIAYRGQTNFLAAPGSPATAGDVLVIYSAGLGPVTPAVADGAGAPGNPPATTINQPTVSIGGIPAPLQFSGLTPGFAGLYQVNVLVPPGITPGNQVPVILNVGGQISPVVTIAVK